MTKRKGESAPIINRVPLGKLTIFEITEAELQALEHGSPESSHFNLGIAALSVACSFLVALLTTTIDNLKTFCVFVIVTAVGLLGGVAFSILWWRSRGSVKNVAQERHGSILVISG